MVIIDGSCLKYLIVYGGNYKSQIIENPNVFCHAFLDSVLSFAKKFNCCINNKLYIAVDRKGKFTDNNQVVTRNYWRQKFYNTKIMLNPNNNFGSYKFSREDRPKDEIDWETIEKLYAELLDTIDNFTDFCVIKVPYLEADDIAAILAQYNETDDENIIITNDKDMRQIVNHRIKLYNPYKKELVIDGMNELEKILFFLSGDVGDSIPPVLEKKKEKSWLKMLNEKPLEQIFKESVEPLEERFKINTKIMDLNIKNIPEKLVELVIEKYNLNNLNYKEMSLVKDLKKYSLNSFVHDGTKSVFQRYKEFQLSNSDLTKKNKFNYSERKKENIEKIFG